MSVQYSPLCDVSETAYLEYVRAYRYLEYVRTYRLWTYARSVREVGESGLAEVEGPVCAGVETVRGCGRGWLCEDASGLRSDAVVGGGQGVSGGGSGQLGAGSEVGASRVLGACAASVDGAVDGVEVASAGGCGGEELGGCVESGTPVVGLESSRAETVSGSGRCAGGAGALGRAVRGKWYDHNKKKKAARRQKRAEVSETPLWRRKESGTKAALQASLEAKWAAENEVAKLRAEQELVLLRARDMEVAKKRQHTKMVRDAEVNKVQTEKAFGYLAKTGNVPGFAETVVTEPGLSDGSTARSDGSGISPDSSVSQQEIRQMQKDLVDGAAREKEASDREMRMRMVIERFKALCPGEDPGVFSFEKPRTATTSYTLDSKGKFVGNPPDPLFGYVGDDGRYHVDDDGY